MIDWMIHHAPTMPAQGERRVADRRPASEDTHDAHRANCRSAAVNRTRVARPAPTADGGAVRARSASPSNLLTAAHQVATEVTEVAGAVETDVALGGAE